MKQGFRTDIAMLRLLAITTVVAFHAYGMCYVESHIPQPATEAYRNMYEHFNQCIPINVAMPLFMFISGFLFGMQIRKGKYDSIWQVAKDKARRLLLPYYVFMPIMMLTYSGFSLAPFYTGGYWHLWFLPGIFWSFIATWLLRKPFFSNKFWIVAFVMLLAYIMPFVDLKLPNIIGLPCLKTMLCYFLLGALVCRHEEWIEAQMKRYWLAIPLAGIYFVTIIFFPTEYGGNSIPLLVSSTCAIMVLWYLFRKIPWERFHITPWLISLSTCSFGIYIFHNWMEVYIVSTTAKRLFPIVPFAEQHLILFPILFTLAAFIISAVLTWLLLRTKIGRFLLG